MIFKIDCDNFVMLYDLVELIDVTFFIFVEEVN